MAIQTRTLGSVSDAQVPPRSCSVTYSYDDAALVLTAVDVTNDTNQTVHIDATATATGRNVSVNVAAGQTLHQNVPTNQANKLAITIDARGRMDGVEWHLLLV
jgi:hypothetical protein